MREVTWWAQSGALELTLHRGALIEGLEAKQMLAGCVLRMFYARVTLAGVSRGQAGAGL